MKTKAVIAAAWACAQKLGKPVRRPVRVIAVLITMVGATACPIKFQPTEIPTSVPVTVSPKAERLPVTVGAYYSQEFKEDKRVIHGTISVPSEMGYPFIGVENPLLRHTLEQDYIIAVGAASAPMFDGILQGMFAAVMDLEAPTAQDPPIKGIIVPSVGGVHYEWQVPHRGVRINTASVQYNLRFLALSGDVLAEWSILGTSTRTFHGNEQESISGMQAAMADAARQLVTSFYAQPGVQAWLLRQDLRPPSMSPKS